MNDVIEIEKELEVIGDNKSSIRGKILDFESELSKVDGAFFGDNELCPLKHSFADGIYVREIFIPKGTILTGKIHKHEHPNFLLSGEVDVVTESGGKERLKAPMSMISPAGTKRVVHAVTDVKWATVHHNPENTNDLEKLEDNIIAKNYLEYEKFDAHRIEKKKHNLLEEKSGSINNCGLVALKNICDFKNISMRTLMDIAEDNGVKLYPYKISLDELDSIPFPAIIHSENHFDYIGRREDLRLDINYTGNILLTEERDFDIVDISEREKITGETFAAVGVGTLISAGVTIVGTAGGITAASIGKKKSKEAAAAARKAQLLQNAVEARKAQEEAKRKERIANTYIAIGASALILGISAAIYFISIPKASKIIQK